MSPRSWGAVDRLRAHHPLECAPRFRCVDAYRVIDPPSLTSSEPCAVASGGPFGSATNGVMYNTPPRSERASPIEDTCTSKRPLARRNGDTSAVTSTAATLRIRISSAGTSILKRRRILMTLCTVWPAVCPPTARSPVPSRPTTRPYPTKRTGSAPSGVVRSRILTSFCAWTTSGRNSASEATVRRSMMRRATGMRVMWFTARLLPQAC